MQYLKRSCEVLPESEREKAEDGHSRLHHDELQGGLLGQAEQIAVSPYSSQAAKRERMRHLPMQQTAPRTRRQRDEDEAKEREQENKSGRRVTTEALCSVNHLRAKRLLLLQARFALDIKKYEVHDK